MKMSVELGALKLRNPVLTASGTFGYGEEVANFADVTRLGAIIGKTITHRPRAGNAPPRTCETPSGMLNAIGLQNVGIARFIAEKLPHFRAIDVPLVVNIAGESVEDFADLAAQLDEHRDVVRALELNISCPNVAHGLDFATNAALTEQLVRRVKMATKLPVWVKLSPNVTDITETARAAEAGGADALSAVNTFVGMAIDVRTRKPRLSNVAGGLSGPAIRPLALRAVYRCYGAVKIPIIGIGGIIEARDAIEFLLAGARAVQIGTATFVQPDAALRVLDGIEAYMTETGCRDLQEIIGAAHA